MKDPTIPVLFATNEGVSINLTIPQTQAQVEEQGYTYNQSGLTYNQSGIMYGGVYNAEENMIPLFLNNILEKPNASILNDSLFLNLTLSSTQALLEDQGFVYNQTGFTYNQLGLMYGGVYNANQDILPLELSFEDIYSKFVPPPPLAKNTSLAPGFFLFIPQ